MKPAPRQYNDGLKSGHGIAGGTAALTNVDDESLQSIFAGGAARTVTELPFVVFSTTINGTG